MSGSAFIRAQIILIELNINQARFAWYNWSPIYRVPIIIELVLISGPDFSQSGSVAQKQKLIPKFNMPIHYFLFEIQIIENGFTGPISYRETGPRIELFYEIYEKSSCWALVILGNTLKERGIFMFYLLYLPSEICWRAQWELRILRKLREWWNFAPDFVRFVAEWILAKFVAEKAQRELLRILQKLRKLFINFVRVFN